MTKMVRGEIKYYHVGYRRMDDKETQHYGIFSARDLAELLEFLAEDTNGKGIMTLNIEAHKELVKIIGNRTDVG